MLKTVTIKELSLSHNVSFPFQCVDFITSSMTKFMLEILQFPSLATVSADDSSTDSLLQSTVLEKHSVNTI
jgi:hypothetical protein